jgi:hypothetical protein
LNYDITAWTIGGIFVNISSFATFKAYSIVVDVDETHGTNFPGTKKAPI